MVSFITEKIHTFRDKKKFWKRKQLPFFHYNSLKPRLFFTKMKSKTFDFYFSNQRFKIKIILNLYFSNLNSFISNLLFPEWLESSIYFLSWTPFFSKKMKWIESFFFKSIKKPKRNLKENFVTRWTKKGSNGFDRNYT